MSNKKEDLKESSRNSCDEAYESSRSPLAETQTACDELKIELTHIRKICKMPAFYLANYFIELRTDIDKLLFFKLTNVQDDNDETKNQKTKQNLDNNNR